MMYRGIENRCSARMEGDRAGEAPQHAREELRLYAIYPIFPIYLIYSIE
jgi:hypothetical protein